MFGILGVLIQSVKNVIVGNPNIIVDGAKKLTTQIETTVNKETTKETNTVTQEKVVEVQKKWYHFSFFYRGTDFQPPYFYMFVIFLIWLSFCILKFSYYYTHTDIDVPETFILQLLGVFVGMFWLYNAYNKKDNTTPPQEGNQ